MIFRLFRRRPVTIDALYGAIVAQARRPEFYVGYGAPDTTDGRFDMIILHLVLLCRRLGREPGGGQEEARGLSQQVFDMFCADMDHNLREMGVGDLSVPKRMRKFGEAFYGRLEAYDRALAAPSDGDLAAALGRNVLGEAAPTQRAGRLAAYAREAARRLDATPLAALAEGQIAFPDPGAIAAFGEVQA
jgi:cytochrome b pre-mRNA-processing protein 3